MKKKVKCRRCQRLILQKTADSYQGYSRQCLAKVTAYLEIPTIPTPKPKEEAIQDPIGAEIVSRLRAVLPSERVVHETATLEWVKNWQTNTLCLRVKA